MIEDKLIKEIKKIIYDLKEQCKVANMETKTIESFFEGYEISTCPYCHTPNLVCVSENERERFDMYMCNKCNKTYMDCWEKK